MADWDKDGPWKSDTVGESFSSAQGCFHKGYPPSAGTHDESGCIDYNGTYEPGLKQLAFASVGSIYFYRTAADGFTVHGHTVPVGNPDLAWLARTQITSFYAGRNGLANQGPFRFAPGVSAYRWAQVVGSAFPSLKRWEDPWHGDKPTPPPPPRKIWPGMVAGWPGATKVGWGEGKVSGYNLLASCAVGIRGYAGWYGDVIDKTWDIPAANGLARWQLHHQPWAGKLFTEQAWNALQGIPVIKHDEFNPDSIHLGERSHESYFAQMLLALQGFSRELGLRAEITWRARAVTATKAFQSHVGIKSDGIVDPVTWKLLWETHA